MWYVWCFPIYSNLKSASVSANKAEVQLIEPSKGIVPSLWWGSPYKKLHDYDENVNVTNDIFGGQSFINNDSMTGRAPNWPLWWCVRRARGSHRCRHYGGASEECYFWWCTCIYTWLSYGYSNSWGEPRSFWNVAKLSWKVTVLVPLSVGETSAEVVWLDQLHAAYLSELTKINISTQTICFAQACNSTQAFLCADNRWFPLEMKISSLLGVGWILMQSLYLVVAMFVEKSPERSINSGSPLVTTPILLPTEVNPWAIIMKAKIDVWYSKGKLVSTGKCRRI